jgi:hypothetical protein
MSFVFGMPIFSMFGHVPFLVIVVGHAPFYVAASSKAMLKAMLNSPSADAGGTPICLPLLM